MCLDVDIGKKDHLISAIVLPMTNKQFSNRIFSFHVANSGRSPGIFYLIFKFWILITVDLIIIPTLKQLLLLLTKELLLHTPNKYL